MTLKPDYRFTVYRSPIGPVYILADDQALLAVGLNCDLETFAQTCEKITGGREVLLGSGDNTVLNEALRSLRSYFDHGQPLPGDLPVKPTGTTFQMKVWRVMREIPHGQTWTYGQLAEAVGSPTAARAVGSACRANPIPLFVPCHRVIGAAGSLVGFGGGGIIVKQFLLNLERRLRR